MTELQYVFSSPTGPLYLVASEAGLKSVGWKKSKAPIAKSLKGSEPAMKFLSQAVHELTEYFKGQRKNFSVKLDAQGTEFQKKVWEQLKKIPYGKTSSYAEIAKRVKNDKAVRAVGTANGRNPLCIIVPCHRVINASGALGGYAGGLAKKTLLLELEKNSHG